MGVTRFKLRTIFVLLALVAIFLGYFVNFTRTSATCVVSMSSVIRGKSAVTESLQYHESGELASAILKAPRVKSLSVIESKDDPEDWLRKRLEVAPIKPNSEILTLNLFIYPFVEERESIDDYPIILETALELLMKNAKPDVECEVLQSPTPVLLSGN